MQGVFNGMPAHGVVLPHCQSLPEISAHLQCVCKKHYWFLGLLASSFLNSKFKGFKQNPSYYQDQWSCLKLGHTHSDWNSPFPYCSICILKSELGLPEVCIIAFPCTTDCLLSLMNSWILLNPTTLQKKGLWKTPLWSITWTDLNCS